MLTVLAVDTVDSTGHVADVDPDQAQELLDRIFDHLNRAVEQAGGLIVSYSGDGGLAVFGWPNSLEDHADRACEAAWRMQELATRGSPLSSVDGRSRAISRGRAQWARELALDKARRAGRDQHGRRRGASRGDAAKKRPS